ncbi:glycosyltransferase [Synechococcus sp. RS9916]|uniref:glycosyltransferase n=1 Tax=Synechococcus sp. RS9916 TaxID=221359 RepID=UPI0002EFBF24|nr:glycosyltransferase [Synechococcus sp. RS9916]
MKIILFSNSDHHGGASLTALNLASALFEYFPKEFCGLYVSRRRYSKPFVYYFPFSRYLVYPYLRNKLAQYILSLMSYSNPHVQSLALFPSALKNIISQYYRPIVHLHWINGEFISISDLDGINSPVVWTLHDCWPFLGTEHHDFLSTTDRFYDVTHSMQAPSQLKGIDLSLWTWKRKLNVYRQLNLHVICPSNWMKAKAQRSLLLKDIPLHVIPNAVDTCTFSTFDRKDARTALNIHTNKKIIMLSCYGNSSSDLKGFSFVPEVIRLLALLDLPIQFLIVGSNSSIPLNTDNIISMGNIHDPRIMARCYQSSDLFLSLSKFENLPTVCIEAQSCGVPVFAFDVGGTRDTIADESTGFLASPYELTEIVSAIHQFLVYNTINGKLFSPVFCRNKTVKRFSFSSVANQHIELYRSIENTQL